MFLDQIEAVCREECGLDRGRVALVGVSGGPDSLCLLDALHRLGYPLVVACLDHALRPESAGEVEFVRAQAARRGLHMVTGRVDVPALAEQSHLSIEEAARTARYRFLFAQARAFHAQAVVVGHHADDQVETVLMHLLRGAGLAGLKGMPHLCLLPEWDAEIPLARPLLGFWRDEIEAYCRENDLSPLQDSSNLDTTYFRNRLRHELIPYLQNFNPRVKEALWRTSAALAGDAAVLDGVAQMAWERVLLAAAPRFVSLSLEEFRRQPPGLQRVLVRRAVAQLRPALRDVDFAAVERAVAFARHPTRTRQMDFIQGLRLFVEGEQLFLAEWDEKALQGAYPQMAAAGEHTLAVPGVVHLPDGWSIHAEMAEAGDLDREPGLREHPAHAWLDSAALAHPLVVRSRLPGDRFQPLGMQGHTLKLSDFFINARLPQRARAAYPLIFSGQTLAWIPLFRPADLFRVTAGTQTLVHVWVQQALTTD